MDEDELFDLPPIEGVAGALVRGTQVFEQLKNVESASAAERAVFGGALSLEALQEIVLAQVYGFRQAADDADEYDRWCAL